MIALGGNTGSTSKIRTDGVSSILGLLERRYELAEAVLYHRTKLAAAAMLDRALYELWDQSDAQDLPERLLELSDDQLTEYCLKEARDKLEKVSGEKNEDRARQISASNSILSCLQLRTLYSCVHSFRSWAIPIGHRDHLTSLYAPRGIGSALGSRNRAAVARGLENDFELPAGSLSVSCTNVKAKIAEVEIRVNGRISTFSNYEEKAGDVNGLSGGHLEAQIRRFDQLWRLDIFADDFAIEELKKRNMFDRFRMYINDVVFALPNDLMLIEARNASIARDYIAVEQAAGRNSLTFRTDEPAEVLAARNDPAAATGGGVFYPNGARGLRTYVDERPA